VWVRGKKVFNLFVGSDPNAQTQCACGRVVCALVWLMVVSGSDPVWGQTLGPSTLGPVKEIELTKRRFEQNGVDVKGVIFNAVVKKASAYGSYGYYNYEYKSEKA